MLHKKSFDALKIDLAKYLDKTEWKFLLKNLKPFGCNSKLCHWIEVILILEKLLMSNSGKHKG